MKVIILCGIPGAGKTRLRKARYPRAFVCSTDDHFMVDGEYRFDPAKLGEAHAECLRRFVGACLMADPSSHAEVVVDNTNTTVAELAPYAAIALAYGHELEIVTVHCAPSIAADRNVHGVPSNVVMDAWMRLRNRELPPWWQHTELHPDDLV